MTLDQFNALPEAEQLAAVFATAAFVATRWEAALAVHLYYVAGAATGFFAEVYYDDPDANQIVRLRSFTSTDQLADYAARVQLPPAGEEAGAPGRSGPYRCALVPRVVGLLPKKERKREFTRPNKVVYL